jgi:hypothetical protein
MNLYVDLATRRIVFSPKLNKELVRVDVKRGDVFPLSIVFISNGKPVQIATGSEIVFCAKKRNDFEGDALVLTNSFTLNGASTDNPSYDGVINLNSDELIDYLDNVVNTADDLIFADLHSEINWSSNTESLTTNTLILRVYNDIYKGDEGNPVITPGSPFVFPNGLQTATITGINGGPVTINSTLVASHIHGNIAGSVYTHARAGEQIYKGNPVYVSSYYTSAGVIYPVVSRADASNAAKMPAIGIASADAANNADTHVIIIGQVESLDTQSFNANAELYVASGGGLTATQPADRTQLVARVERSQQNNGAILVTIGESSASNAIINTIVRRDSTGAAKFNGLAIPSFISGNVVTVTTAGAFANTSRSGIDSRTSFPNTDVTNATSLAIANRIVKRDGIGDIAVSGLIANTISVGDIDASGYVMAGGFESPAITLTDSVYLDALTYVFGAGADQALKDALGITFSNITDSESGTAYLNLSTLALSEPIVSGLQPKLVFTANPTAVGDGQQILWQWYDGTTTTTTASISSEATGSTTDKLIFQTTAGGALVTSLDLTNTLATFSGSISSLGESYRATSTFTYASGAAAAHRTALGLDTLFDGKANLIGGNTFTGSQSINGSVTTSDKVTIDSASAVTNPKLLIMATTAQGVADGVPLVIKGSGVNRLASINLRSSGGSGELYDAWVSGKVGGGIQVNNSFTVSGGNSGPITGSTIFIVQSTGSVGVGVASPNAAAILDVTSTTKGFLPPRMTTTQRNAIASPPAGLVIYNTTTNNLNSYSGSAWVELVDSADLGTNVANFLTSPTSDNLASALTDENGTGGGFVRADGATLTGATLSGQTELTSGQTGATQYSVATRSMAEDSLIWASRVRLHAGQVSGTTSFGGSTGGTVGQFSQLALSNTINSLSRIALAANFLALGYSGSGTNFGIPWQIRIPFGSIMADTNSVFRVWTGSHVTNIGVPYNGADGIPMGMSSIGFEFRANPASPNQHQIRLIARDGISKHGSTYSLTNGSPIISGLSTSAVNAIAAEIAAGRTVYAMSGTLSNVAPDSKGFSDGAVVISATGTTVTLDRNAVTTNASVQIRFVFAAEAGTFAASSWVNVGPIGSLNRQYDAVIENLGNGTANLYCVGWSSDIIPPLQTRVPIATLNTGVPATLRNVVVGSQALEAHLITNGVNAPPNTTANSTTIFNAITKIGI